MSEDVFTERELKEAIEGLCRSKAEEFRLIGYEHVTSSDVWSCVSHKYDENAMPQLHKLVNDILSLKVIEFMNFVTISAYRGSHF